ncbi:MAG: phenylalanyl-tRNA synthetase, alpha subunit [Frankiales bacterium]|nr:phenylalanyl-tRNA synthetase, alpha subunit [Frankiales bacterium]
MSAPDYDPKQVALLDPAQLDAARQAGEAAFAEAADLEQLAAARTAHLGGNAHVNLANREIGVLPPAAKGDAGKRVNELRQALDSAYAARKAALEDERDARVLVEERVDVSILPGAVLTGGRHPLTTIQERIADVFVAMGWEVAEGPEVEHEWFNFDALNMPADHPAREMQDTLWLAPAGSQVVLRTQTSPVQIRSLLARGLPCYVVAPGRVFRNDALDATHSPVFGQVEGLCVDEGITMAHLRGTLEAYAAAMFGTALASRLRPSYFPFTEPSAELDIQCFSCKGAAAEPGADACRVCSSEGWIEVGGCGMVNPAVLVACGIDPERYSGFAFGMGLDRTLMFRHGITDIRDLYEGDQRFTAAFGTEA